MFEIFDILFTTPITNVLVACYKLLLMLHVPYALGFAIILLTVLIKLLLWPLTSAQIKSATKMQKLAPKISDLKEKYKNDKQKQQAEIMKLYQQNGINPASGCIPLVIQFPVLIALYHVLTTVVSANTVETIHKINSVVYFPFLELQELSGALFFNLALTVPPAKLLQYNPAIILVPVITGLLQFVLSKMMIPTTAKKDPKKKDDFQTAFQAQSVFIFPFMIAYFSYSLPLGLSLYWNTFTLFGILQQYLLVGPGGMEPWFAKIGLHGKRNSNN